MLAPVDEGSFPKIDPIIPCNLLRIAIGGSSSGTPGTFLKS